MRTAAALRRCRRGLRGEVLNEFVEHPFPRNGGFVFDLGPSAPVIANNGMRGTVPRLFPNTIVSGLGLGGPACAMASWS